MAVRILTPVEYKEELCNTFPQLKVSICFDSICVLSLDSGEFFGYASSYLQQLNTIAPYILEFRVEGDGLEVDKEAFTKFQVQAVNTHSRENFMVVPLMYEVPENTKSSYLVEYFKKAEAIFRKKKPKVIP